MRKTNIAAKRAAMVVPLLIADAGEQASWRYVEFFTANIRNPNTRLSASYALSASNAFACIPGSNASALARSWICPAVRTIFNGRPRASTST